jgi:hypothetical protein
MENINQNVNTVVPPQTPPVQEVQWPVMKRKSKMPQILAGVAALILVAGVAVAAFFVSNRISGEQAVAPTAPVSEPKATGPALCNNSNKDNPFPLSMTFTKAGKIKVYSTGFVGSISVSGPATYNLYSSSDGYNQVGTFDVSAGQTYSFNSHHSSEGAPGKGWRPMWGGTKCGPQTLATPPGQQVENGCGSVVNIGGFQAFAASTSDLTGITSGGGSANVQCWGDAPTGDWPSEYDYNDWMLAFGYEQCTPDGTKICAPDCPTACGQPASTISTCKDSCGAATTKACPATTACICVPTGVLTCPTECPTACGLPSSTITCKDSCNQDAVKQCTATAACPVGASCNDVSIFKIQSDGTLGTNPVKMTQAELAALKVGDKLSVQVTGSKANLKAKFKVTINNTVEAPDWRDAVGYVDADKKISFFVYEIKVVGSYKFEAQVSSKP